MTALFLVGALAATTTGLLLHLRQRGAEAEIAALGSRGPLLEALVPALRQELEYGVLGERLNAGLADLPYREPEGGRRVRLGDALEVLAGTSELRELRPWERAVGALYRVQYALDLPDAALEAPLRLLGDRARGLRVLETPVVAVRPIQRGAFVDRSTMTPLGPGTHVAQPLGLILRAGDGRVLVRPRVLCR